jgi:HSP20 family protein
MPEKSAVAAQTAPSRLPVKADKSESISERIERISDVISRRAYELFERDGGVDGLDMSHWLEAEKEFLIPVQTTFEETPAEFVVRAQVSGFTARDLEVNVEPRRVTISGKRESNQQIQEPESPSTEESFLEIFRSIELPCEANATKVAATLKDGVLEIRIPKAESQKTIPLSSQLP